MSSLKLLFLISGPFNYKTMQSLLIGFHSVGKASKYFFLLDGDIFQVLHIKQKLALFLFSAYAYYRVNCMNYAAIIVCVDMDISVVCMCVLKQCVCAPVIFEREMILYCES